MNGDPGVRGKPVAMAIEDFVTEFLGCTAANTGFVHVRPYILSVARAFLNLLNYSYPKLLLTCRDLKAWTYVG